MPPGTFVPHLPSFGGRRGQFCTAAALSFPLGGGDAWNGVTGHKEPLWPVNGAAPWCGLVGGKPLAQCLCFHERFMCSFLPPELCALFSVALGGGVSPESPLEPSAAGCGGVCL